MRLKIRYVVTVCDYGVNGQFMTTTRRRCFRNLAIARHYEKKFYQKARRRANTIGKIENWGSTVHNFVNGANYAEVRTADKFYDPVRTITITCRTA